jgi:hypothetical protein
VLKVEVDWSNDGTYTAPGDDVTAHVRARESAISLQYGRDDNGSLATTAAGTGGLTLDNSSRRYSPRNTASLLYGKIRPARPVRITRTVSGTTYTLGQFHTDDSPINPDLSSKTVSLSLLDSLADFRGPTISTQLYRGLRTGEAIGKVLDAVGWSASLRDLDPGATVIPWWWEDGTDAMTALEKLIQSEGPPALLTMGTDGEVIFRDRHHRLTRAASLTSQGTWRNKGQIQPVMLRDGFQYDESWRNIINTGSQTVDVRVAQPLQAVWTSEETITLSNGEQKMITVSGSDPFINAVAPVNGVDFITVSGSVTTTLTRTSGASAAIILTATGATILTGLSLRACPVTVANSVTVSASSPDSVTEFGARAYPNELPWCTPDDAQAILDSAVADRALPLTQITASFLAGRDAAAIAALLPRDLSDRVRVVEGETVLDAEFFIESIRHDLSGEHDHRVTFTAEAAPVAQQNGFRFNTAGSGFNDGVFAVGTNNAATMFRFDGTSGHRFDEGSFCL